MYEIIKNGAVISRTEKPNYIYKHDGGFYVLCEKSVATGVAVNGTPYALSEESLGECEVVIVVEKDAGRILHEQIAQLISITDTVDVLVMESLSE